MGSKCLYVLIKIQIGLGSRMQDVSKGDGSQNLFVKYVVYQLIVWTFMLIFELTKNSKGTLARIKKSHITPKIPEHEQILKLFNAGTPNSDIFAKYPDIQWVIMDNSVYDITNFIHPGG